MSVSQPTEMFVPDKWTMIGYFLAMAMLMPLSIWLKANYAEQVGAFILSPFY